MMTFGVQFAESFPITLRYYCSLHRYETSANCVVMISVINTVAIFSILKILNRWNSHNIWLCQSRPKIQSLGLGQTSNFSWVEPNSNLGWPKLSYDRLLGQTSNLGRVEPITWIRSLINFLPNEVKYALSHNFFYLLV